MLTGAAFSHVMAGVGSPMPALVLLTLVLTSWALRPEDRRLGAILPASAPGPSATPAPA